MSTQEDKRQLLADFNAQLYDLETSVEKEAKALQEEIKTRTAAALAARGLGPPVAPADPNAPVDPNAPPRPPAPQPPPVEEIEVKLNLSDTFTVYEELVLPDGRILRRYDTGAVRVENPKSGVIQEERLDGSLVVSLPSGTVIFQEFRGEPLLVYNVDRKKRPIMARVSSATLPGETVAKFVFFFQDEGGTHLVEMGTLRYYKVRPPAAK